MLTLEDDEGIGRDGFISSLRPATTVVAMRLFFSLTEEEEVGRPEGGGW